MGHQYAGSNSFPSDYTIPDDLDDDAAVSYDVAFEALGDRTVYLKAEVAKCAVRRDVITTTGTWTCPASVTSIEVLGMGGGGAGGGGGGGTPGAGCGGGGGGGAKAHPCILTVTPGVTYNTTIGAGGTAGAAGSSTTAGGDGGDGGDTLFDSLATFRGAMGGQRGHYGNGSARQCWGGQPGRSASAKVAPDTAAAARFPGPGEGGMGRNEVSSINEIERTGGSTAAAAAIDSRWLVPRKISSIKNRPGPASSKVRARCSSAM